MAETTSEQPTQREATGHDPVPARLAAVVVVLLLTSLVVTVVGRVDGLDVPGLGLLRRWFDVNGESTVPAWFSSVLLFVCAQTLLQVAGTGAGRAGRSRYEKALAAGFLYLSVDETVQLHERLNGRLGRLSEASPVLAFPWVAVAVPVVAVVGVLFLSYLRRLPRATATAFVLAGALYVGGAVGLELVGAAVSGSTGLDSVAYVAVYTVEEGLEMAGIVVFLAALRGYRGRLGRDEPGGAQPRAAVVLPSAGRR